MDEHATYRGRGPQQPRRGRSDAFGTGFSRSGFAAWSTPRSGKIRKPILRRCGCRWDRPSSPFHPAAATRCPISRRNRPRSTRSISTKPIFRCSSSSSPGCVPSPATPISGSFSARPPRPPTPNSIASGCGSLLDADARAYWDKRNMIGRPRHAYFTDGFYRHGMLGRFIGLAHLLAKFARIDLTALLNGKPDAPERIQALDRLHRLFHSPLARLITGTPALLFSLGIPPQQRALLGGGAPLNEVLHERLLRLINGHPNETNYFAWQALHRGYPGPGDRCLPPYLQRSQFERMRDGAGLIIPVHANLRLFLESLPAREVDAVVLLDFAGLDGAGGDPRALECDRPHRQRQCSRDLPHRRRGIAAGKRGARAAPANLASATRSEARSASSRTGPEFTAASTATSGAEAEPVGWSYNWVPRRLLADLRQNRDDTVLKIRFRWLRVGSLEAKMKDLVRYRAMESSAVRARCFTPLKAGGCSRKPRCGTTRRCKKSSPTPWLAATRRRPRSLQQKPPTRLIDANCSRAEPSRHPFGLVFASAEEERNPAFPGELSWSTERNGHEIHHNPTRGYADALRRLRACTEWRAERSGVHDRRPRQVRLPPAPHPPRGVR